MYPLELFPTLPDNLDRMEYVNHRSQPVLVLTVSRLVLADPFHVSWL